MTRILKAIRPYARYLLAAWIIIILILSSIPNLPSIRIRRLPVDVRFDYIAHFIEYSLLSMLSMLSFTSGTFRAARKRVFVIILLLVIFAVADESHQLLIPNRTFQFLDIFCDVAGIAWGAVFTFMFTDREEQ